MTKEHAEAQINFLELHAENNGAKIAVIGPERQLTYSELCERARHLACGLYNEGVRPGHHVALMTYNAIEYTEIMAALTYLKAGGVLVGSGMKPEEIEHVVNDSDAKFFIFCDEFNERILPYKKNYPHLLPNGLISFGGNPSADVTVYEDFFASAFSVDLKDIQNATENASPMIYTSGTTGKPKGAARTSGVEEREPIMNYLFRSIEAFHLSADEVHLICCPLYHSAPLFFSMLTFIVGGTRVLMPRFDAKQFLELVAKHNVTSTHIVPTMVGRLNQIDDDFIKSLDLSSLRTVVCGAAPLHPNQKLTFIEKFGPVLYEYYGSTETGLNTILPPMEIRKRPDSVGRPFADNELKIVDENGNEVPDGTRGRLFLYNAFMMTEYYKKDTDKSRLGKFITVGDIAVRDSDGFYYIVDRETDMIIRGGVNIYPAEIERVLNTIPGIADSAVVGKPDEEFGEITVAFITPSPETHLEPDQITAYLEKHMAKHKIPTEIKFVDNIPKTVTGKVLKRELRKQL